MADFPVIISLSPVPQRNQNINDFSDKADAFLGKLPTFRDQLNQWAQIANALSLDIKQDVQAAQDAEQGAISARDAAQVSAGLFSSVADGLASGNEFFSVVSSEDDKLFDLYQNDGGSAVFINSYAGGPVGGQEVTTSTGKQTVAEALDARSVVYKPEAIGPTGGDWADALQQSASLAVGGVLELSQEYVTSKQISIPAGVTINALEGSHINGELISAEIDAPDNAVLSFKGGDLVQLPALSMVAEKGKNSIVFSSSHNLSVGDIFCIWDTNDFSFSPFRSYYHKGEWCRVAFVVSATEVVLESPLYDTYQIADVELYTADFATPVINGELQVSCVESGLPLRAVEYVRCKDVDASAIKAYADKSYAALSFKQCFNVSGSGIVAVQKNITGTGTDYGLAITNCQHVDLSGYFSGARRGVAHGGSSGPGGVPVRNSKIRGTIATTNEGLVSAADWHGNCEFCLFDATIHGGLTVGGKNNKVRGTIFANIRGEAVSFSELANYNHDLYGCEFIGNDADPDEASNRGLVDLGGASVADDALTEAGVLDFTNSVFDGPNATRVLVMQLREHKNNGAELCLVNAKVRSFKSGSTAPIAINAIANADNWKQVMLHGFKIEDPELISLSGVNRVATKLSGIVSVSYLSAGVSGTQAVTFPYPLGETPVINVSQRGGFIGTVIPIPAFTSESGNGFTAILAVADAVNMSFSADRSRNVHWTAEILPE